MKFAWPMMQVGPDGSIYVIEKGTYPVSEPYEFKNLLYAINLDGNVLWQIEAYRINDVVIDADSNIYVAGEIMNEAGPYPGILSFDVKGQPRWTQAVKDTNSSEKISLVMDRQKAVVNAVIKTPDD